MESTTKSVQKQNSIALFKGQVIQLDLKAKQCKENFPREYNTTGKKT